MHPLRKLRALLGAGLALALPLLASGGLQAQSLPVAFDPATGSAPAELIIPQLVPVIFSTVSPGDAPLILRTTTLITQSWFDAIAPYGETTVGVSSRIPRRPLAERSDRNRNIAILHSSFHVLNSLYPAYAANWRSLLLGAGLDPDDTSLDPRTPVGIGNLAGRAVVASREHDGMNQLGDIAPRRRARNYNRQRYADYTGYAPVNTAYELRDPSRWQPNILDNGYGIFRVQQFVTPQYALVRPYSYRTPKVFRSPRPEASDARNRSAYRAQVDAVLAASAAMTDRQKMIAELFDDKITSLGFSALFASVANQLTLEDFVTYDFLTNLAAFDTGIAIWQEKARHDAVRPFSAVRHVYGNRPVTAWGGPGRGTVTDLPASEWRAYLPVADHPEYPSGSAAFCAAHARTSQLFFGSDTLGWSFPVPAGSSRIEPGHTPAAPLEIRFETWSQFAEECGQSRFWAGVHFPAAISAGAEIGRRVGGSAFLFVASHLDGSAPKP
jgi:hypothetical protein